MCDDSGVRAGGLHAKEGVPHACACLMSKCVWGKCAHMMMFVSHKHTTKWRHNQSGKELRKNSPGTFDKKTKQKKTSKMIGVDTAKV